MNKRIKIYSLALAGILTLGASSCSQSFLDENKTTSMTTQYFDTPEGLRDLALGLPQLLRLAHSHEFSYALTNYGTDEFQLGSDPSNVMWNNYSAGLQSVVSGSSGNRVQPQTPWDICYVGINTCNMVIEKAPNVLTDEAEINTVLGEAYFMRGWAYLFLVQQWGGVPLKLTPSNSLEREFNRASLEESIQQVINDFTEAYNRLSNPTERVQGKIYKDAAAHFLAKALLHRQSEICSAFNASTKDQDLSKALSLCEEVIANRPLANNYADLWNYTGPDGPNEKLPEVLLAAQYTATTAGANGRYKNNMCLMFVSIYQNWTGMTRNVAGGREYARLRTTNYSYDVFDRINDSRFWKSFRTKMIVNAPGKKNALNANNTFSMGQLGVLFIINNPDDAARFRVTPTLVGGEPSGYLPGPTAGEQPPIIQQKNEAGEYVDIVDPETGNLIPNVLPRYRIVEGYPNISTYAYSSPTKGIWAVLSKYLDGSRPDYNSNDGTRDGIVARVAETYLMAAEIKIRQGQYADALTYINQVRNRGAYQSGEDRSAYVDGAQTYASSDASRPTTHCPWNSYYESNNIPVSTDATSLTVSSFDNLPAEDEAIIAKLNIAGEFDRALCFLLNERSRELMGEMYRWADLSRTQTLVARAKAFNEDVVEEGTIGEHHMLRPIPQSFLDEIWKEGRPLTAEEKQAMQNPGY